LRASERVDVFLCAPNTAKARFEVVRGLPRAELEGVFVRGSAPLPPVVGMPELGGVDVELERGERGEEGAGEEGA
jgi:hypothetical protein